MRRRDFFTVGAAAGALSIPQVAAAADEPTHPAPTKDGYTALGPDEALSYLIQGNEAFLSGKAMQPPVDSQRRLELAKGQAPFCAYVTCSDRLVPPGLLFGRGLGELFIIRNAGNTVDTVAMGSIEYAVAELRVPLVVVMGHEACGAVKAAQAVIEENARFPAAIDDMIEPIIPAALSVRDADGRIELAEAVRANVSRVVYTLRKEADPILLEPQRKGKLKIVGAYYDLEQGRVDFFDQPAG